MLLTLSCVEYIILFFHFQTRRVFFIGIIKMCVFLYPVTFKDFFDKWLFGPPFFFINISIVCFIFFLLDYPSHIISCCWLSFSLAVYNTSLSILSKAAWIATHSFSLCLFWKIYTSPSIMNERLPCVIIFLTWSVSSHSLLICRKYAEISVISWKLL